MTDNQLAELQAINDAKCKAAIETMGAKWCLHPANQVKRKKPKRGRNGKFVK